MIWSPCTAIVIVVNVVIQEVWSVTDAQADIICTAVCDAIDVMSTKEKKALCCYGRAYETGFS